MITGTYTGGGIGVIVDAVVDELVKLGHKVDIVAKKSLKEPQTRGVKVKLISATSKTSVDLLKKYDVVHVMGGSTLVIPALRSNRPCIFTFQGQTPPRQHGGAIKNLKAYAIEGLYKATMKKFNVITSASKFGILDIRKRYGVKKAVWIPNGVDRKLFHKERNAHILAISKQFGHPLFLGVGNLYPVKGWMETLGWFEEYLKTRPSAHLMIAGTGTLENEMRRRVRNKPLEGHVEILGEIPLEKLNYYYNACDAYLSGSPYEGFCLPAIEALACGKPLVVRKRGAMIEHAIDSGCGKVFEDSCESFTQAANAALALKPDAVRRRAEKYLEPFTWKNAAGKYSKIYVQLLEGKARG